jgi:hypothetical protein
VIRVGPVKFGLSRPARNVVQKASRKGKKGGKVSNSPGKGGLGMGPKSAKEKFQPGRPGVITTPVVTGTMANYWRVAWMKKGTTYYAGLAELDLGGNPATGGTAISGDFANKDVAFDGNPATAWSTGFSTRPIEWIGYNFPEPVSVGYITVTASVVDYFALSFDVQYSHDGVLWETEWAWSNVSPKMAAGEVRTFNSASISPELNISNISAAAFIKHPPGGSVSQVGGAIFLKHPPGPSVSYVGGAVFLKMVEGNFSWRILWDAVEGANPYAAMGEVEFRSTVGGADQATGGGVMSSGVYSASSTYQASNAFDDTNTTRWIGVNAQGVGSWIGYEFPAPMASFAEVALTMKNDSSIGGPADFRVQRYESFAAGWVTVLTVTGEAAWAAGETRTYAIV